MGTIIASMVLAGMFALAVRSIYLDMKTGGCCGGCSGCAGCSGGKCSRPSMQVSQNAM